MTNKKENKETLKTREREGGTTAYGPAIVPGLPQRHGTGGRGQQPAPPQGASDKTSGSISTSMPSSAPPGISPEPPAVYGPLPGDDETVRLPSPV